MVAVAALTEKSGPLFGYVPNGDSVVVDRTALSSEQTLVLLEPSEEKYERIAPQPRRPGLTIQDPGDGDFSGSLTLDYPDGRQEVYPLARVLTAQCTLETCDSGGGGGGGGGGGAGGGSTYLRPFETRDVCDNGFCGEGNEFEFRVTSNNVSATLRIEGWPSTYASSNLNLSQIGVTPASGYFIDIQVWETDGWPNPDDRFQWITYSPNSVSDPHLTLLGNGSTWPLKEQPHIGVFDPIKVVAVWGW